MLNLNTTFEFYGIVVLQQGFLEGACRRRLEHRNTPFRREWSLLCVPNALITHTGLGTFPTKEPQHTFSETPPDQPSEVSWALVDGPGFTTHFIARSRLFRTCFPACYNCSCSTGIQLVPILAWRSLLNFSDPTFYAIINTVSAAQCCTEQAKPKWSHSQNKSVESLRSCSTVSVGLGGDLSASDERRMKHELLFARWGSVAWQGQSLPMSQPKRERAQGHIAEGVGPLQQIVSTVGPSPTSLVPPPGCSCIPSLCYKDNPSFFDLYTRHCLSKLHQAQMLHSAWVDIPILVKTSHKTLRSWSTIWMPHLVCTSNSIRMRLVAGFPKEFSLLVEVWPKLPVSPVPLGVYFCRGFQRLLGVSLVSKDAQRKTEV